MDRNTGDDAGVLAEPWLRLLLSGVGVIIEGAGVVGCY
jgi:hypothetical protein